MNDQSPTRAPPTQLVNDLRWLVRLRWVAGLLGALGVIIAATWLPWTPAIWIALLVIAFVLAYNVPFWTMAQRLGSRGWSSRDLAGFVWVQLVLDFASLTVLSLCAGGAAYPLFMLFVLHMVIVAMILPRRQSYAAAAVAIVMVAIGLWSSGLMPTGRHDLLMLLTAAMAMFATVLLTGHIVHNLRESGTALREQHQRMEAVLQTAADGIITIDARGIIQSCNSAAERLFGYQPGELIGRNVSVLMPATIRGDHDGFIASYLRTKQAKIIGIGREVLGMHRDGHEIPLDLSVSEVALDRGMLFTGIVRDITERKRAERELDSLNRSLQRHQQFLIQNEKMTAMGQMAAGIVHEVSNPLASMDSVLQLVQRHPERLNPQTVDVLREQVRRIHTTIRQLTDFAHPNETAWEERPLNEVVAGAVEMVRFDRRMRAVEVQLNLSPEVGSCRMMVHALQQVMVNMIINALDAMAGVEARKLIISTSVRGGWYVVELRDNGHGIAPEHLPHVFEPFFTTKPIGHGTGLGLSISYSLVKRHGGECEVTSRVGDGTTFRILLPTSTREAPLPVSSRHWEAARPDDS